MKRALKGCSLLLAFVAVLAVVGGRDAAAEQSAESKKE